MSRNSFIVAFAAVAALVLPLAAPAQTVSEDFTGNKTTNPWYFFNGACLTAGSATGVEPSGGGGGQMPGCVTLYAGGSGPLIYNEALVGGFNGTFPDTAGHGALRFTNGSWTVGSNLCGHSTNGVYYCGGFAQNGGIVSATPFPTGAGIAVTFKTVTYLGNSGGAAGDGADGMSFFLMDASQLNTATITGVASGDGNGLGSWGGSLGYSCSNANPPFNGLNGGYVGLGIDEYGNFLNGVTNTLAETGTSATGDNTASGGGYQPGRIGLRGAGNVAWNALTGAFPTNPTNAATPYYPASLAQSCANGGGTWNASANACISCPSGYVYGAGTCQSSPPQCSTGTYNAGTGLCETCSSGTYNAGLNNCQSCSSGTYDPLTNLCESCSSGTYDATSNTCDSCASGTYNANIPACELCSSGTYNPNIVECQSCSSGTVNVSGNGGAGKCNKGGATLTNLGPPTNPTLTQNPPTATAALAPSTSAPLTSAPGVARPDSYYAVQNTCRTGNLWNYSVANAPTVAGAASLSNALNVPASGSGVTAILDYGAIPNAYAVLPSGTLIANEAAATRGAAVPIFYDLKISQAGLMSLSYSINGGAYQQVIKSQSITASNGPLPANFLFGFAGSSGGSTNVHEILCFKAQPETTASSSAGASERQSAKLETGAQAFFAFYNPNNWVGRVTASSLGIDSFGNIFVATSANWDAECVLTGIGASGTCPTTTVPGPTAAESPASRVILTWSGSGGIAFEYNSGAATTSLTASEQTTIDAGDSAAVKCNAGSVYDPSDRVAYLRGDRSCEINLNAVGLFRARSGVLADIIDSSPAWVGPPLAPYPAVWNDRLYGAATNAEDAAGAKTYIQYAQANESRLNVVYTGSNDGLLHGFRTGSYNSNGTFCSSAATCTGTVTPNDGFEVLGYMPGAILQSIHNTVSPSTDYSNSQYGHQFFVDATPGTSDLFYGSAWHTWVVGGLGPGGDLSVAFTAAPSGTTATLMSGFVGATGTYLLTFGDNETRAASFTNNSTAVTWTGALTGTATALGTNAVVTVGAIYALDVTDPTQFSENNAASLVVGEWNSATVACAGSTTANGGGNCGHNLGNTYGTPSIRRLHNGDWAVIFGNGLGSASGDAGIYVMTVDPNTAAKTFYYLSTSTGSLAKPNGIAFASPVDLDGDHITDYVYAGDLQGNLWRFDLTSNNPSNWAVTPGPVFTTPSGQPITTSIVAASGAPYAGLGQFLMLLFGTGEKFPLTNLNPASYASGTQSLYGVWDWNMTGWNAGSNAQYTALTAAAAGLATGINTITAANLQAQTVTINAATGNRDIATNQVVCFKGTATCAGGAGSNTKFGWSINLPGVNEQIVFNPELVQQALTVNSIVPAANDPTSCAIPADSGITYVFSAMTGGAFNTVFLPPSEIAAGLNTNPAYADANAIGMQTNATGSSFISANSSGTMFLISETNQLSANGSIIQSSVVGLNLPPNTSGRRISWVERR